MTNKYFRGRKTDNSHFCCLTVNTLLTNHWFGDSLGWFNLNLFERGSIECKLVLLNEQAAGNFSHYLSLGPPYQYSTADCHQGYFKKNLQNYYFLEIVEWTYIFFLFVVLCFNFPFNSLLVNCKNILWMYGQCMYLVILISFK